MASYCPYCGEELPSPDSKFCPACDKPMIVNLERRRIVQPETQNVKSELTKCPYCKKNILTTDDYCAYCGKPMIANLKNENLNRLMNVFEKIESTELSATYAVPSNLLNEYNSILSLPEITFSPANEYNNIIEKLLDFHKELFLQTQNENEFVNLFHTLKPLVEKVTLNPDYYNYNVKNALVEALKDIPHFLVKKYPQLLKRLNEHERILIDLNVEKYYSITNNFHYPNFNRDKLQELCNKILKNDETAEVIKTIERIGNNGAGIKVFFNICELFSLDNFQRNRELFNDLYKIVTSDFVKKFKEFNEEIIKVLFETRISDRTADFRLVDLFKALFLHKSLENHSLLFPYVDKIFIDLMVSLRNYAYEFDFKKVSKGLDSHYEKVFNNSVILVLLSDMFSDYPEILNIEKLLNDFTSSVQDIFLNYKKQEKEEYFLASLFYIGKLLSTKKLRIAYLFVKGYTSILESDFKPDYFKKCKEEFNELKEAYQLLYEIQEKLYTRLDEPLGPKWKFENFEKIVKKFNNPNLLEQLNVLEETKVILFDEKTSSLKGLFPEITHNDYNNFIDFMIPENSNIRSFMKKVERGELKLTDVNKGVKLEKTLEASKNAKILFEKYGLNQWDLFVEFYHLCLLSSRKFKKLDEDFFINPKVLFYIKDKFLPEFSNYFKNVKEEIEMIRKRTNNYLYYIYLNKDNSDFVMENVVDNYLAEFSNNFSFMYGEEENIPGEKLHKIVRLIIKKITGKEFTYKEFHDLIYNDSGEEVKIFDNFLLMREVRNIIEKRRVSSPEKIIFDNRRIKEIFANSSIVTEDYTIFEQEEEEELVDFELNDDYERITPHIIHGKKLQNLFANLFDNQSLNLYNSPFALDTNKFWKPFYEKNNDNFLLSKFIRLVLKSTHKITNLLNQVLKELEENNITRNLYIKNSEEGYNLLITPVSGNVKKFDKELIFKVNNFCKVLLKPKHKKLMVDLFIKVLYKNSGKYTNIPMKIYDFPVQDAENFFRWMIYVLFHASNNLNPIKILGVEGKELLSGDLISVDLIKRTVSDLITEQKEKRNKLEEKIEE